MGKLQRAAAFGLVAAVGALLVSNAIFAMPAFGSFPQRQIGEKIENAVGQRILENAPQQTGAANIITSVVWDYRAYDTFGEATVLFTAVCGVLMLFLANRRREQWQA